MKTTYSIHMLTTYKNEYRQKNIIKTWLKDRDNYMFVTDKSTNIGNQFEACSFSGYESTGKKLLSEIHRIYKTEHYKTVDWILLGDDDICINIKKLEKLLPKLDRNKIHGEILYGTWPNDRSLNYISGGAGILISSKILEKNPIPQLKYLLKTFLADVCLGIWSRENNIEINNLNEFHSQPPAYYNMTSEQIKDSITFHYIKTYEEICKLLELFEKYD